MSKPPRIKASLDKLEGFLRAEQRARARLRSAGDRVVRFARKLQAGGLSSSLIAIPFAKAQGVPVTVEARKRIASNVRLRLSRAATRGRGIRTSRDSAAQVAALALGGTGKELQVGKLIKRVVTTEEFLEEDDPKSKLAEADLDDEPEDEDPEDPDQCEDDDDEPERRSPRSRRSRSR
jgi:hypothetical protein